jgi:hypothetical protein
MMPKSYSSLIQLPTFEERFNYLKLRGVVGQATFGFDRALNQAFYHSREWKHTCDYIYVRDNGCDLAVPSREIYGRPIVHHINPITIDDIERGNDCVFDPENLILTVHDTHNAITYGNPSLIRQLPKERRRGDTLLW